MGTESAAVTMALRELGYTKAANFAGGYVELVANTPDSKAKKAPLKKKIKKTQ
jgi:rhodanese-related sulfurtransferase